MSISPFLEIKKTEHHIKNQFSSVSANLGRLKITIVILVVIALTEIIYHSVRSSDQVARLVPLFLGLGVLGVALVWLLRYGEDLGRKYYTGAEYCLTAFFILLITFMGIGGQEQAFLLVCLSYLVLTQLIGIRLSTVFVISLVLLIAGIIIEAVTEENDGHIVLETLFMATCCVINFAVLYASTLESRKNFILREQIEMQTNQTNDIWTILVP